MRGDKLHSREHSLGGDWVTGIVLGTCLVDRPEPHRVGDMSGYRPEPHRVGDMSGYRPESHRVGDMSG